MAINNNRSDILSRLDAMLVQESTSATRCFNYFKKRNVVGRTGDLDESCRKAIVIWLQQVQDTLKLSSDSVWMAMSMFDRYLCSGRGDSARALEDKCKFQLAAITAFYTAIKIHEPVVLGIDSLLVIVRHSYTENEFLSMEKEILSAIEWRVSSHTAMDYARALLELINEDGCLSSADLNNLIGDCEKHMGDAVMDIHYSCYKRSELGIRCVITALAENETLSLSKKESILDRLSESCDVILSSSRQNIDRASPFKQYTVLKRRVSSQNQSTAAASNHITFASRSPICISCTSQQA